MYFVSKIFIFFTIILCLFHFVCYAMQPYTQCDRIWGTEPTGASSLRQGDVLPRAKDASLNRVFK